jgi:hypothetical protein
MVIEVLAIVGGGQIVRSEQVLHHIDDRKLMRRPKRGVSRAGGRYRTSAGFTHGSTGSGFAALACR